MSLIFRTNATRAEKAYTLLLYGWLALAFYGMLSSFVGAPWVVAFATCAAIPVAFVFFVPLLRDGHPGNRIPSFGSAKRWAIYGSVLLLLYAFSWIAIGRGAAGLFNELVGAEKIEAIVVAEKIDGRGRTPHWSGFEQGCDYSLTIRQEYLDRKSTVCVEKELWASVGVGDTLDATFRHSSFGSILTNLSRRRSRENPA